MIDKDGTDFGSAGEGPTFQYKYITIIPPTHPAGRDNKGRGGERPHPDRQGDARGRRRPLRTHLCRGRGNAPVPHGA